MIALLLACQHGTDTATVELAPRGDCNPVVDSHCLLPFPSSFYLSEDDTTGTGFRLDFAEGSLPVNVDGAGIDPEPYSRKDGFPVMGSLVTLFPGATETGVIGHQDLDAYLADDVKTVILNAETGERVPHWVELEARAEQDDRRVLLLRPAVPFDHATQYVVGIRGIVDAAGAEVAIPEGFEALVEGGELDDDLERQRALYDDTIFPLLDDAGFARDELQLAWDFVTASPETELGPSLWLRDDALSRVGDSPSYRIETVEDRDCSGGGWGREITGELTVPSYLEEHGPGGRMAWDGDLPAYVEDVEVGFDILVPCSLMEAPGAGWLVQYGHGLLNHRGEIDNSWLGETAEELPGVVFALDWTGMSATDSGAITLMMIEGGSDFGMIPERLSQAWAEFAIGARMMQGPMLADDALAVDGQPVLTSSNGLLFYGLSQGAVIGGGYTAYSPDVERAVLMVPGAPFSLLLTRASGFDVFLDMMKVMYDDWADISVLIHLFEVLWSQGETGGWAPFLQDGLWDGTPGKEVLMQIAIGDGSVSELGGHLVARTVGASLIEPEVRDVWGLELATPPFTGSGVMEYDYGERAPVEADHNAYGEGWSDPHNSPVHSDAGRAQVVHFLQTGEVIHTCDGPCDPE